MILDKITKEQEERLLLYATYTILYLNDTACFAIQQLCDKIPNNKESKKIYGALLKRANVYLNTINKIVDNKMDYYCDYCTAMDEICNESYFAFEKAIQKAYANANIEHSEYFSMVETMRSMVEMSIAGGKQIISNLKKMIPQSEWLEKYLMMDILRVANNFSNWEYRKIPKDTIVDLSPESDVMKSLVKLSQCLIDFNSFDKAYRKATNLDNERKE